MDTSDTPWFWYYLADCGRWHRFEVSRLQLWNVFSSSSFIVILQSKRCRKWSRRFVSTWQEDPNNPIKSEDVENYFQGNPAGILKASLFGCQSKIDFKGVHICILHYLLFYSHPGCLSWLCVLDTEMLQTDVSTGRQRRIRRDYNLKRRWNRFKALQHKPDLCRTELRQWFGLVSRKTKVKLCSV